MWRVPLTRPTVGKEELEAVRRVFDSGMLTQGPETARFEREFADYLGVKHAVATSSGTTALHLALLCCGIERGDEVIVPDYTFPATANVVVHCGAKPVLCDIRLREFQIDPTLIEDLITPKTTVIMPVSEFGLTADMKPILEVAEKHSLDVVEDACPALGSKRYGKYAGTFGEVGCFSFHPRKPLAIGEGGILVTDDEVKATYARRLRNHGQHDKWNFLNAGYNYRLSDVQSAIGRMQLQKLPERIREQRRLAKIYDETLRDTVEVPYVPRDCFHTYQSYVALTHGLASKTIERLRNQGIEAQFGTSCLHVLHPFQNVFRHECVNSYVAWHHSLTLPLFQGMTAEEQQTVVDGVTECAKVTVKSHR